jgi:hypothetical protein
MKVDQLMCWQGGIVGMEYIDRVKQIYSTAHVKVCVEAAGHISARLESGKHLLTLYPLIYGNTHLPFLFA